MSLEFDLIDAFFKPLSIGLPEGDLGIGDDGAVLTVPEGHQLVVVTDTLVSGVHFPVDTAPYDIAWKALAVNLSDLAAMGAVPGNFSLALTLPSSDAAWLKDFSEGLKAVSQRFDVPLIGGDTTKGPLTITVSANGWVPKQQAILRSGAQLGDLICVTNTIGDGALGLKLALNQLNDCFDKSALSEQEKDFLLAALNRPVPQLEIAADLRGLANSAIDISDGLLADLGHILERSNGMNLSSATVLGAEIELENLPLSAALKAYIDSSKEWSLPLIGGDDYQLCMTVPEAKFSLLKSKLAAKGVSLTGVGRVTKASGIQCLQNGQLLSKDELSGFGVASLASGGYSHF